MLRVGPNLTYLELVHSLAQMGSHEMERVLGGRGTAEFVLHNHKLAPTPQSMVGPRRDAPVSGRCSVEVRSHTIPLVASHAPELLPRRLGAGARLPQIVTSQGRGKISVSVAREEELVDPVPGILEDRFKASRVAGQAPVGDPLAAQILPWTC